MTIGNTSENISSTLKFYYDSNGIPFILDYNGTIYFYVTNLQGDVIGLATSEGMGGYYRYDAWGQIVTMDAASTPYYNALNANPLRYRGYVYDNETGFYYLQSRYYDPAVCRFINADGLIASIGSVNGNNLYSYCFNNPVNMIDNSGEWGWYSAFSILGGAALVVSAAAFAAATGGVALLAMGVATETVKTFVVGAFIAGCLAGAEILIDDTLSNNGDSFVGAEAVYETMDSTYQEFFNQCIPGKGLLHDVFVDSVNSITTYYAKTVINGYDEEMTREATEDCVIDIFKSAIKAIFKNSWASFANE